MKHYFIKKPCMKVLVKLVNLLVKLKSKVPKGILSQVMGINTLILIQEAR